MFVMDITPCLEEYIFVANVPCIWQCCENVHKVCNNENCTILGYYAASSGNS